MLSASLAHAALKDGVALFDDCIEHPDVSERASFFSGKADVEMNGDGVVNSIDLGALTAGDFNALGPDGANANCRI